MAMFDGENKEAIDGSSLLLWLLFLNSGTEAGFPGRFSWRTPADPNRPHCHHHVQEHHLVTARNHWMGNRRRGSMKINPFPQTKTTTTTLGFTRLHNANLISNRAEFPGTVDSLFIAVHFTVPEFGGIATRRLGGALATIIQQLN